MLCATHDRNKEPHDDSGAGVSLVRRFSTLLKEMTGISFPENGTGSPERKIKIISGEFGFDDPEDCLEYLTSITPTPSQIDRIARHLTVGETYFFREPVVLETITREVLKPLLALRESGPRRLRIWSAACCTGEEPYTLAIMLDRIIPDPKRWNISILGTDINMAFLEKARLGVYTPWSFRGSPQWLIPEYFDPMEDGRFEISPRIRKMVTFSCLNLARDDFPSLMTGTNAIDLILCRNVLMYFEKGVAARVTERFKHSLLPEGYLVSGLSETGMECFAAYGAKRFPGAVLFTKGTEADPHFPVRTLVKQSPVPLPSAPLIQPEPSVISKEPPPSAAPHVTIDQLAALYAAGEFNLVIGGIESLPAALRKGSEAQGLLIRSIASLGDIEAAEKQCRKALGIHKMDPGIHFLLASILQEQGRYDEALKSFRNILYLEPALHAARFALGAMLLGRGDRTAGNRQLKPLLKDLEKMEEEELVPCSDGLTVSTLRLAVRCLLQERGQIDNV